MINVDEMSELDLEKALAKKKKERQNGRLNYESTREHMVLRLHAKAVELHQQMAAFKAEVFQELDAFREVAKAYGDVRETSKGGYSLRSADGRLMLRLDRNTKPEYDERAEMAENLIREFLEDKVKVRSMADYRAISTLLSRNKKGDFSPAKIAAFLTIKDNYDDERWVKAMRLFEESYVAREVSYSVSFYQKDAQEKDQLLPLNFATMEVYNKHKVELQKRTA